MHGELADVYGCSAPSYAQVKFWVGEFKRGRTSLEDDARSGRPLDATDEEMCTKVRDLITKTYLYNFDPLKPHFYMVKLVFTGVYIIFLISAQKHRL